MRMNGGLRPDEEDRLPREILRRYRWVLGLFIVGLIVSGVTAFPLTPELSMIASAMGIGDASGYDSYSGLKHWIAFVLHGLRETDATYPFMRYGTDWLAFGHLVIALFFMGPFFRPRGNVWVLWCGVIACFGVLPLAMICGPLRGIPFYWRLIDSSFGVIGLLPLGYCIRLSRKMEQAPE